MPISLHNRQRAHKPDLRWLRAAAEAALPLCRLAAKSPEVPLLSLGEIEVSIVSDKAIAKVHGDFLNDPSPTDVITFPYGEIIVSADTAARYCQAGREALDRELARYMIHGLLHLAGWDDHSSQERRKMHQTQERVLNVVAGAVSHP